MKKFLEKIGLLKKPNYEKFTSRRRDELSLKVDALFKSTISYGLFSGLQLSLVSKWSKSDRGAMILGLYEKEVLDLIGSQGAVDLFINIGAADGYYAAGVLYAGIATRVIAYEIDVEAHDSIKDISRLNNVSERLEIRGGFNKEEARELTKNLNTNSLILMDIEGAEFEILSGDILESLSHCHIIIETHEFIEGGEKKLSDLIQRVEKFFNVVRIFSGARDLSNIDEVSNWPDNDRWLLCSEGRPCLMSWLYLTPKRH